MEVNIIKDNFEDYAKGSGGVYLIRDLNTGFLKIGCTKNLKERFYFIKNSFKACGITPNLKIEAFLECENYTGLEKFIHNEVYDFRIQSEWFNISDIEPIFLISSHFKSSKCNLNNYNLLLTKLNSLNILNILNNKNISSNDKILYITLFQLCLEVGYCSLPLESLSKMVNISESTTRRCLKTLQQHKLLLYHNNFENDNKQQLPNSYYVIECDINGIANQEIYNKLKSFVLPQI